MGEVSEAEGLRSGASFHGGGALEAMEQKWALKPLPAFRYLPLTEYPHPIGLSTSRPNTNLVGSGPG